MQRIKLGNSLAYEVGLPGFQETAVPVVRNCWEPVIQLLLVFIQIAKHRKQRFYFMKVIKLISPPHQASILGYQLHISTKRETGKQILTIKSRTV